MPEDVDGKKVYKTKDLENKSKIYQALKDGRKWKKDYLTSWAGHARVRYADCKGSNECVNANCPFKVEYGVVNTTQFEKRWGSIVLLACNKIMDQQERVVFSIVPILLLILLLTQACRVRFLLTYNYLDLGTKESAAVSLINIRWQRQRQRRTHRQAWVYPRPQGWFKEMYNNRLL